MARYEKGRKEATRARIVQLASERFRREGIDGIGVAALMEEAGLTHGGFYAHFESKEALVREAVLHALASRPLEEVSAAQSEQPLELATFIDRYLSVSHRDRPDRGCAIAALGPDLVRRPRSSRAAFQKEGRCFVERVVASLPEQWSQEERVRRALSILSHLVGTITVARFTTEKAASQEILDEGRRVARHLAGLDPAARQ